jgi:serine-type D-Ala-D-Ala carboxypeptidase/endopeptidase (penicillin-binding protein 4)
VALAVAVAARAALAGDATAGSGSTRPLAAAISQVVSGPALSSARVGVLVTSLDTGQEIYASGADELLNPASNVKLFTASAALARLGPEFRFDTEIFVDDRPGAAARTLYLRGKGDPSITNERLWAMAGDLAHLGLRNLKELVVDDGYFDLVREGPGFEQEFGDRSYLAPVGALSLNFNSVAIHVAPGGREGQQGRVELEPPSPFLILENHTLTVKASARRRVTLHSTAEGERQRIAVEARLPLGGRSQVFYRKIDDPPLYFGHSLKRLLELRGVSVAKVRRGAVPADSRLLLVVQSEELGDIVRKLLKTSNNFVAEQILKTLGAEAGGVPGTWPKGVEAVEAFLAELGLARGTYLMKNGSGLNDANRFSARQTVALLREMWRRFPVMAEFVSALPVAGRDGTIRWRMEGTEAAGRLRAKTGSLESVASLSGYVETRGNERLAFAILVNDYTGRSGPVVRAVDSIGSALAASGGPPASPATAVTSVAAAATAASPGADPAAGHDAHVAGYYRMALQKDRRNVPVLRAALRTERDPVLQMAAAEAVYLSDPDSTTARRTFLEAITGGEPFGRLLAAAARLRLPPPVVGSLGDLAAEGGFDALARLVELTPTALADGTVSGNVASTWVEVARTAPEETLAALRASPPSAAGSVLDALAQGLARSREPQHPFLEALRRAAAGSDSDLAAFARGALSDLEERLRAGKAPASSQPASPPAPP